MRVRDKESPKNVILLGVGCLTPSEHAGFAAKPVHA